MPTSLTADQNAFDQVRAAHSTAKPVGKKEGRINFAGSHWPAASAPGAATTRNDVETALREARVLSTRGVQVSSAALRDDPTAVALMTTWFGPRAGGSRDWWSGVHDVLARINAFLLNDINVYYRDAETKGKPNDYPDGAGKTITERDVSGYAESSSGDRDGVIGLCRAFFAKERKGNRKINLKGFDSVGGVLIHELSHNLCNTDDHELNDGTDAYETANCGQLATEAPSRAWYNADNIEYFCEEAHYGPATPKAAVTTGATDNTAKVKGDLTAAAIPSARVPSAVPVVTGAQQSVDAVKNTLTQVPATEKSKEKIDTGATESVSDKAKRYK
jgi:hypothetical protein